MRASTVRRLRQGAAVVVWILAAAACGSPGPPFVGRYLDDASITSTVRTRFVDDKTMNAETIQVETTNGTVVLSGQARSLLEKTNAESITMKVPGVKLVRNELVVKP